METSNIKSYAPKARVAFMDAVAKRLNTFGISANKKGELQVIDALVQGSVLQIGDNNFDSKLAPARQRLVERSEQLGYAQLVEQVAYTWFNRLSAIRYMEIHGYLGHGFRVLSHPNGDKRFEILDHAQDAAEDLGLDRDRIIDLKLAGNKNEELYRELLLGQCHKLHEAMPFLFEALNDETELLLPDNLIRTDSILRGLVDSIPEEDWQQVEVIGWLYQFYISEKKDQVIGKVVKTEDIPAATQLFTPNWIVKYMVQNSLGAQWLSTYPDSPLKAQMEYYIEPAEQSNAVNAQLQAITPSELNLEELTLIDPASGSGHILVEAYDLFKAIYLERGYRQRDIPQLILEKNLFGLDIDQRAAQLTGFALMMKGREDDRRLFERGIKLNVMAMVDSASLDVETLVHGIELSQYDLAAENLTALKDLFEHATTFGSLIQVPQTLAVKLPALKHLSELNSQDMFVSEVLKDLEPLVQQAQLLALQYDSVVANPPYMGLKFQNRLLKTILKQNYTEFSKDMFSAFIVRCIGLTKNKGRNSFVTPFMWMFIISYESLRKYLRNNSILQSLIQLEYNAFSAACIPVCCFSSQKVDLDNYKSGFVKLSEFKGIENQSPRVIEAIFDRNCGWFYEVSSSDFRNVPGEPLVYWASKSVLNAFTKKESFSPIGDLGIVRKGMSTGDNNKFVRLWTEIDIKRSSIDETEGETRKWVPYNNGGEFRKWYGNIDRVVNWNNDGYEIKNFCDSAGNQKSVARGVDQKFKTMISWTSLSSSNLGVRFYEDKFLSDQNGNFIVADEDDLMVFLAFLCSYVAKDIVKMLNPTMHILVSNVSDLPLYNDLKVWNTAKELSRKAVEIAKKDWESFEISWGFKKNPLVNNIEQKSIRDNYCAWIACAQKAIGELTNLEEMNNDLFIRLYGMDRQLDSKVPIEQITLTVNPAYRYGIKGTEQERNARFRADTMTELVSYTIGCMMGRYSLDQEGLVYAHAGNEGFDASLYKTFPADSDGIIPIMDDEWYKDDACNRVVEFVKMVWGEDDLTENLQFIADSLCLNAITPKKSETAVETIRRYLSTKFYKDHMQTYKKRPIYWLFSSGKEKAFECLVYLHRYNESTLSRMRTEYVTPLLGKYQAYAEQLDKQLEIAESTQDKKRLEKELKSMDKKQSELREFDDKLKHYADMRISIDLDDGVKENYGKFGDLLADVKNITGEKPEVINAS